MRRLSRSFPALPTGSLSMRLAPSQLTLTSTRLGSGSFATVYLGYYAGSPVAIKLCPLPNPSSTSSSLSSVDSLQLSHFRREISRYHTLRHPCILQFFCVAPHPKGLLLVTELMQGGSLFDAISQIRALNRRLSPTIMLSIAKQIANALAYLHASHFSFGDLKSMNVLLSEKLDENAHFSPTLQVKLCDFGLSRNLNSLINPQDHPSSIYQTAMPTGAPTGTYAYMSPEAFAGIPKHDVELPKKADVYALAIVLWELATVQRPWHGKSVLQLVKLVTDGERPPWTGHELPAYRRLVERCWAKNPATRPTADEVAEELTSMEKHLNHFGGPNTNPVKRYSTVFNLDDFGGTVAQEEQKNTSESDDEHDDEWSDVATIRMVKSMRILDLARHSLDQGCVSEVTGTVETETENTTDSSFFDTTNKPVRRSAVALPSSHARKERPAVNAPIRRNYRIDNTFLRGGLEDDAILASNLDAIDSESLRLPRYRLRN